MSPAARVTLVAVILGAAASCLADPTHNREVDELGSDPTHERNGPLHRAGEPCLDCHGGSGPGNVQFSVAGTVYRSHDVVTGVQNADVTLTDSTGASITLLTNEVGNFYVSPSLYDPVYPMWVTVSYTGPSGGFAQTSMQTHVGREGSCGACHQDPEAVDQAGHVYVTSDDSEFPQ